jgi:hypothetical protein
VPVDYAVQQALEGRQLPPPTDQIRLSTPSSTTPFLHAQQPLGRDGLVGTLELHDFRLTQPCHGVVPGQVARAPVCRHPSHDFSNRITTALDTGVFDLAATWSNATRGLVSG